MSRQLIQYLDNETQALKTQGLFKEERVITSAQDAVIQVCGNEVINLCANNYLGLANHPDLIHAGQDALASHGFGMASVRFICGTQDIHKELENKLAAFLGKQDAILYSSCFDANTGLFETLLGQEDVIISDALNHASVIDGVRLCKAKRMVYANNDMAELKDKLEQAQNARFRLIATDGVFSMDGTVANLAAICELADAYDALVMVDDSHAVGFFGATGRGTPEHCGVGDRVDILTGTLGKSLGGASGGYTAAHKTIVTWLRQRSRPYLFSNSVAPVIVASTLKALSLLQTSDTLREKLRDNSQYFRGHLQEAGFTLIKGDHPIIPVMLFDAKLAQTMADRLLAEGIYVIGFSYPVVGQGKARIRTQMSAAHERTHLDRAIASFIHIGKELDVIK